MKGERQGEQLGILWSLGEQVTDVKFLDCLKLQTPAVYKDPLLCHQLLDTSSTPRDYLFSNEKCCDFCKSVDLNSDFYINFCSVFLVH